jgi:hypothetical protein
MPIADCERQTAESANDTHKTDVLEVVVTATVEVILRSVWRPVAHYGDNAPTA